MWVGILTTVHGWLKFQLWCYQYQSHWDRLWDLSFYVSFSCIFLHVAIQMWCLYELGTGKFWHGPTTLPFPWLSPCSWFPRQFHTFFLESSWHEKLSLLLWLVTLETSFSGDLFKRRFGFCVAWWECEIPYGATPLCQMWDGVKIWTQRSQPGKNKPDFVLLPFWFWDPSPKSGSLAESKAMHPGRNWSKPTAEMNIDSGVHPSENSRTRCHAKEASCFMTRMLGMPSTCMYICMQFLIILSNSFNFILWCQAARVLSVKHGRFFLQ